MLPAVAVDFANVQALIVQGYTHSCSRHLLFEFTEAAGARAFLAGLVKYGVTSAKEWGERKPDLTLNVGLSFAGLKAAAALDAPALDEFPFDFQRGPTAARLHDLGSGPAWWNGVATERLHCLVSLHAEKSDVLDRTADNLKNSAAGQVRWLGVGPKGKDIAGNLFEKNKRELHFGYSDGITRPDIAWADPVPDGKVDFRRYLLGYGTDAIQSAPMPLTNMTPELIAAIEFARDGTYLAFRLMYQDVAGFNRFLDANARQLAGPLGKSHDDTVEWLAAKVLGRWRDGTPLVKAPNQPNELLMRSDDFDYRGDPAGVLVPFSAHIRVVNPRDPEAVTKAHRPIPRLLRRGMPYGPALKKGSLEDDGEDRGLIGLFLCNSLSGEFEKVLDWINDNNFSDNFDGRGLRPQDPLAGNRDDPLVSKEFLIPDKPVARKTVGLTTFVQTRGTAYFLLPGLASLRKIAGVPTPAP